MSFACNEKRRLSRGAVRRSAYPKNQIAEADRIALGFDRLRLRRGWTQRRRLQRAAYEPSLVQRHLPVLQLVVVDAAHLST